MITLEILTDVWILVLTILTVYLILARQKRPVMTPAEYEEWWLIYHSDGQNQDENLLIPPKDYLMDVASETESS